MEQIRRQFETGSPLFDLLYGGGFDEKRKLLEKYFVVAFKHYGMGSYSDVGFRTLGRVTFYDESMNYGSDYNISRKIEFEKNSGRLYPENSYTVRVHDIETTTDEAGNETSRREYGFREYIRINHDGSEIEVVGERKSWGE